MPAMPGTANPAIRTLLLCDLVASTQLVERVGDQAAADLLARHDRFARDLVSTFNGREIDKSDGFLLLFERPIEAVRFAMAYQAKLRELGATFDSAMASRVGIHLGEVVLRENSPEDVARGAKPLEVEEAYRAAETARLGPVGTSDDIMGPDAYRTSLLFQAGMLELRNDRRFARLCARLGLVEFWMATGKRPDCADEVPYDFKAECTKAQPIPKEDFGL